MTDREQWIETLTEKHGFDAELLDPMGDDQIETMHSGLVDTSGGSDGDETEEPEQTESDDTDGNVVEVDIGDAESFDEYVTERATEAAASVSEQDEREELIATITAKSDEHDEESLAEWPTDALESQADALTSPAQLPGSMGHRTETVTAAYSGDDDDAEAYGTGVAEH